MAAKKARWVTVADAQAILGKSEKTVRRWAKDGKLKSRREGRRILVNVSGLSSGQVPVNVQTHDRTNDRITITRLEAELSGAMREINLLRDALEKQEKQAEMWQGQAAALTAINQQQQQLLLEATVTQEPARQDPEPEQEPARRGWLGRLRDWFDRVE